MSSGSLGCLKTGVNNIAFIYIQEYSWKLLHITPVASSKLVISTAFTDIDAVCKQIKSKIFSINPQIDKFTVRGVYQAPHPLPAINKLVRITG